MLARPIVDYSMIEQCVPIRHRERWPRVSRRTLEEDESDGAIGGPGGPSAHSAH
jgi:hypothetical protein